ncbi:hypothetical protein K8T06_07090, partial [bacterium]|nr:hypothetical protein [bacterium]
GRLSDYLSENEPLPKEIKDALEIYKNCKELRLHTYYGVEEIEKVISENMILRRHLFWSCSKVARDKNKRNLTRYFDIKDAYDLFQISENDVNWLVQNVETKESIYDRLLAMDGIFQIYCKPECLEDRMLLHEKLARSHPALRKRFSRWKNRIPAKSYHLLRSDRLKKAREIREKRKFERNLEWLNNNLETVRNGSNPRVLQFLWYEANKEQTEWTVDSLNELAKKYGDNIANAAKDGLRKFWRNLIPPLPHEEEKRNTTSGSVILGLNGLEIDVKNGLNLRKLSAKDAKTAARYATRNLGNFPDWLDQIVESYPSEVFTVLNESIEADYKLSANEETVNDVLSKLPHSSEKLRDLCFPIIWELISTDDPPRIDSLLQSLRIVLFSPKCPVDEVANIAETRCPISINDENKFPIWWTVWFLSNPLKSVIWLETQVHLAPNQATSLIISICDQLHHWTERYSILNSRMINEPEALKRLILLVFLNVRPEENIKHEGVYSPDPRDNAQSVQNSFIQWLVRIKGDKTRIALKYLADNEKLSSLKDWFLDQLDRHIKTAVSLITSANTVNLINLYKEYGTDALDHINELGGKVTMSQYKVDFVIITALDEEREAMLTLLPGYQKLDKDEHDTHTYYEAWVVSKRKDSATYRLIVTSLAGMGPQMAVSKATAIVNKWHPNHVILVGIACGVRSETNHGDILVANQIVDYTLGKQKATSEREIRWQVFRAGSNLLDTAKNIDPQWCNQFQKERPKPGKTEVRFGEIATGGDVVMDDNLIKKYQKDWPKMIGIEMEGGGTALGLENTSENPEFIMVKAVSDFGKDKHFTSVKPWRPYARKIAAEFALELIRCGPSPSR